MKAIKDIKKAVITHKVPDFDALASACAACMLHECDAVLTITSFESNVEDYFNDEEITLPVIRLKDKDIELIERLELLVVTDCKLEERTVPLQKLLTKADKVVLYDHHPSHGSDIKADEAYIEEIGSSTTIIIRHMKEQGIKPNSSLATLMILGLYEDTGLLSFSSTTKEDMLAAAFLLEAGANLELISKYVQRDMSKEQVFVLNELLLNMNILEVKGAAIGLSYASTDRYIGELAVIAHRIMDMEDIDALFICVAVGERIVIVGRSRADEVDCGEVMTRFGGGGHPSAASAIVKKMMLTECIDLLKIVITEHIRPVRLAENIMTSPVKTVPLTGTFDMAMDLFMKYNLNMMPVVDSNGAPVGLISRRDILQGIKHGLKDEPVRSLMQIEFRTVEPDVPYYLAEEMMLSYNQKMLPVVHNGKLLGVITRTDLLRLMHEEITKLPRHHQHKPEQKVKNISPLLKTCLPERVVKALEDIGRLAEETGLNAYLVGGVVRDVLMGNANMDIDIVVEGDAPALARKFAAANKAKTAEHYKFKTAAVIFKDGFRVDFATSRTEYYTNPASAPEVEYASIRNDLYRRDFSINAMAMKLTGKGFGELLDFFGGQKDITDKKIRVLHSLSFVDDPSRCLRGIRFAVRYGFSVGPQTEKLLKHAVSLNLLERVTGQRMFLELKYILSEGAYTEALAMMKKYDILKFFHDKLAIDDFKLERFNVLEKINGWYAFQFGKHADVWVSRFCILFADMNRHDMKKTATRLNVEGKIYDELAGAFYEFKYAVWQMKRMKTKTPSSITEVFEKMCPEAVIATTVVLGSAYEAVLKEYFTRWCLVTPTIDGNDLKGLGLPPSGIYGDILREIKRAKLDGEIETKEDETALALKIAKERGVIA